MQAQALSRMETSLAEVYRSKQQLVLEAAARQSAAGAPDELGGTTALVAILMDNALHIANIGDCRAVLCRRNEDGQPEAIALSTDHTPEDPDEMARIHARGFEVGLSAAACMHPSYAYRLMQACTTPHLLNSPG